MASPPKGKWIKIFTGVDHGETVTLDRNLYGTTGESHTFTVAPAPEWQSGDKQQLVDKLKQFEQRVEALEEALLCFPVISELYQKAQEDFKDGQKEQMVVKGSVYYEEG
jgi:hypothetical protein